MSFRKLIGGVVLCADTFTLLQNYICEFVWATDNAKDVKKESRTTARPAEQRFSAHAVFVQSCPLSLKRQNFNTVIIRLLQKRSPSCKKQCVESQKTHSDMARYLQFYCVKTQKMPSRENIGISVNKR